MATAVHGAVEYAFDPLIASTLATNTTLGTATRHDFNSGGATNVWIPETLVGATPFRSVHVIITFRTMFTSARSLTGWRVGIKLGATAFNDVDYTPNTIPNSGNAYSIRIIRDVTDYFNTNWTGTSMAAQVGFAVSTNVADAIGNITCKLVIGAYDYDDTSSTYVKTIWIPIQGNAGLMATTKTEMGSDGTAPATNQIPALDTFCPETSKTYRRAWIEVLGTDGRLNTTDFNMTLEVDSGGASTRATIEAAVAGSCYYEDHFIYDTATYSTASAHAFYAHSSLASRFPCCGGVMAVTYEYDPTSTDHLQSLKILICGDQFGPFVAATTGATQDEYMLPVWVEEPDTIAIGQSGVVTFYGADTSRVIVTAADGGTDRTYDGMNGVGQSGFQPIVLRTDLTGGWSLARGMNQLRWHAYCTTAGAMGAASAYVILNYTSGLAAQGCAAHNRTSMWAQFVYPTTGTTNNIRSIAAATTRTPGGLGTHYFLNAYGQERFFIWGSGTSGFFQTPWMKMEITAGEGGGWVDLIRDSLTSNEFSNHDATTNLVRFFNQTDQQTGDLDVETARGYQSSASGTNANFSGAIHWLTHHEITFTASGTISGYAGDGSGITVDIWNVTRDAWVASAISAVGGGYTATVYDNVDTYMAECREDSTHVGRSNNLTPT